jgi:hypothetical protein
MLQLVTVSEAHLNGGLKPAPPKRGIGAQVERASPTVNAGKAGADRIVRPLAFK